MGKINIAKESLILPGNIVTPVQYDIPAGSPLTFILSSGYGDDQFREAVQLSFIDVLNDHGIGWVQYVYPERCQDNRFRDLYISSGTSTLSWLFEWVSDRSPSIGLFGYSFGANITLEVALNKPVAEVVVVNAVFDYVSYRTRQMGSETIDKWRNDYVSYLSYGGAAFPLGYRFLLEAEQQDLERRAEAIECDVYAFQAENDAIIRTDHIARLASSSEHWHAHVVTGKEADHYFEHPKTLRSFVEMVRPSIARQGR
jgi:dienelactone hydrolase